MSAPVSTAAPRRSAPLDATNPVARLIAALVVTTPLLATLDAGTAGIAVALQLALVPATGVAWRTLARRLVPIVVFLPVAAVSMLLYARPGGEVYVRFGLIVISDASIELAIAVAVRVLALGIPAILLFSTMRPTELGDGLAQVLRLPARVVIGTLAGARMLGLFLEDWRSMGLARRARGVADRGAVRRFVQMAFVLLVLAVRRGTKLATAMEARGFGAPGARTWSRPSRLGRADAALLAIAVAIVTASIWGSVALGTFRFVGA